MASAAKPVGMTSKVRRAVVLAVAGLSLLAAQTAANGQNIYQLTSPRIYRVDPTTSDPWYHGYGFGGMGFEPVAGDLNGRVLLVWESPPDQLHGDLLELTVNFAGAPNAGGTNDATLLSQVTDWGWCYDMDYESDERVMVHSRSDYAGSPRTPGQGVGRFIRQDGKIVSFQMTNPYSVFNMGAGERMRGAFAGMRLVAGTMYDTIALIKMNTTTSGIFLLDIQTGNLIDADPTASNGALSANPYIGFAGDTGVTNIANPIVAGRSQVNGLDIVGDMAFVLFVPDVSAASPVTTLMQVDLVSKTVLAVADVSQMLNPNRAGRCDGYTWGFDVSPMGGDKVRILIAECTDRTLTSMIAIDGVSVPLGTDPVDPNAIYVAPSGGGGTTNQPSQSSDSTTSSSQNNAVIWVCPGFGIALPMLMTFVGLGLSARARRPIPPR